jgi:hypothetical protein
MGLLDDFRKFTARRSVELTKLIAELKTLGQSDLTLDSIELDIAGQSLAFRVNVERRAAWCIYIELITRITARPLYSGHGLLRDAASSLHSIFAIVRETLKQAGPAVARGPESLGGYSVRLLNEVLGPFLAEWHPKLGDWEHHRPPHVGQLEHELAWAEHATMRAKLEECRDAVRGYVDALGILAGVVDPPTPQ